MIFNSCVPGKGGIKIVSGECFFVFLSFLCLFRPSGIVQHVFRLWGWRWWCWWCFGFFFPFLTRKYIVNNTEWAVITDFVLVFHAGLFFTSMPLWTELAGISLRNNFSEIHYFSGSSHWEVSQTQKILSQKETVPEIYPTT